VTELRGDDWGSPVDDEWHSMAAGPGDQSNAETWGYTPALSYEDRIRTVLFEAGTRRMEAQKAAQLATAEIAEALHRGHGILSILGRVPAVGRLRRPRPVRRAGRCERCWTSSDQGRRVWRCSRTEHGKALCRGWRARLF